MGGEVGCRASQDRAIGHCKHCQRQTGTAFSIRVAVSKGSLIMEGAQPATYEDIGDSGLPVLRRFCSKRGVADPLGSRGHSDDGLGSEIPAGAEQYERFPTQAGALVRTLLRRRPRPISGPPGVRSRPVSRLGRASGGPRTRP